MRVISGISNAMIFSYKACTLRDIRYKPIARLFQGFGPTPLLSMIQARVALSVASPSIVSGANAWPQTFFSLFELKFHLLVTFLVMFMHRFLVAADGGRSNPSNHP